MSYTITISGTSQPADGESQEQADAALMQKAQALAQTLPAVSAAFIQTMSRGMEDLNPPPQLPVDNTFPPPAEAASG